MKFKDAFQHFLNDYEKKTEHEREENKNKMIIFHVQSNRNKGQFLWHFYYYSSLNDYMCGGINQTIIVCFHFSIRSKYVILFLNS